MKIVNKEDEGFYYDENVFDCMIITPQYFTFDVL